MARSYGDGGYYETGGQWFAYVPLGKGKRKRVRANNEKDARQKWRVLLRERDEGRLSLEKPQTVREFMQQWQALVVEPTVKAKTAYFYRTNAEWYIYPVIGDMLVCDVKPEHILSLLNAMRNKYASQTVRHVYAVGKAAFNVAVQWKRITENPFTLVKAPRVVSNPRPVLTIEQSQAILREGDATRYATLLHLALTTGCRLGELLGLRVCDCDREKHTITINQQVQRIHSRIHIETPKTQSSIRELPVVDEVIDYLNDSCSGKSPERLLFDTSNGTPINQANFRHEYRAILERAGVPRDRNFHLTRHTVATRMSEQGIPDVVIGAILGHSSKGGPITWRYIHVTMEMKVQAVQAVAALLYT